MSKLNLLNELLAVVKSNCTDFDTIRIRSSFDDLLTHYNVESIDYHSDNDQINYIDLFIESLELENCSHHTLKMYKGELIRFSKYINRNLLNVKTPDIRSYLASNKEWKTSTIIKKLMILRSFYNWLVVEEVVISNPTTKIKTPKQEFLIEEGLNVVELEIVRESCNTKIFRSLIEIMYSTGCRLQEIQSMNISDIHWTDKTVIVYGKGKKERKVFLSDKCIYHLKKYLTSRHDNNDALFVSTCSPYNRISTRTIQRHIDKIGKVAKSNGLTKHLHPHLFRKSLAQNMCDANADINDIKGILGHSHSSNNLLKFYTSISDKRKKGAFERYHVQ